ncbi:MAG TPA: ferritin-like domain-containing protein [Polyangiales bacterium]|nr:ferritin-like domain-containing protein [Polyangiales bacterium]
MLKFVDQAPKQVIRLVEANESTDLGQELSPQEVDQVAEIFHTPLTGSYTWDYREADSKLRKLYKLGKERNWNADYDLDWARTFSHSESPMVATGENPYADWEPFKKLTDKQQIEFGWHSHAWTISQFLHGEQGALLVASQLASCAPTYDGKLYAASQTFDEARHVEVFGRYLREKVGLMYPVNRHLKALLDKILTDPRWDLKFIGMQLIIESLALAAFHVQMAMSADPFLRDLLDLVTRDEARHVAFGVTYMEQFVKSLPPNEVDDRAQFAFEACRIMRERIVPTDVFAHYGFDVEEGRRLFLAAGQMDSFRNLLFTRIMPNLNKVGLLTDAVRPKYEELGLMQFAGLPNDGDINWADLSKPLPGYTAENPAPLTSGFFNKETGLAAKEPDSAQSA